MVTNVGALSSGVSQVEPKENQSQLEQTQEQFQAYIQMLIYKLKNQDPTVERKEDDTLNLLITMNQLQLSSQQSDKMGDIYNLLSANQAKDAVNYIGKKVIANGREAHLVGGLAEWNLNASDYSQNAKFVIKDERGNVVREIEQSLNAGSSKFVWNGIDDNGQQLSEGKYGLYVEALNDADNAVNVDMSVSGLVTEIDLTKKEPRLLVNGSYIDLSQVLGLKFDET